MSYSISLHRLAEKEYEKAWNWYALQQPGLEERFFEAIDKTLNKIINGPELNSYKSSLHREAIVLDFPYVVVYRINKKAGIINVIAIHHTSRKPNRRYRRY